MNIGRIVAVKGPVVDVYFDKQLPRINSSLKVKYSKEDNFGVAINLVLEVALHTGNNIVRCIAIPINIS